MVESQSIALANICEDVRCALSEDVGNADVSAALLPDEIVTASIITREPCVVCGHLWVDEVLRQVGPKIEVKWQVSEGAEVVADTVVLSMTGSVRALLTAERTLMNFLQTLSAVATCTRRYVEAVATTQARIFDTRKTIPGLRYAQKHAVHVGGGSNHRMGLYDAVMLKENHLLAYGSIEGMVKEARQKWPNLPVIVEVENMTECESALACAVDVILLDNFTLDEMAKAVVQVAGRVPLEASGNVDLDNVLAVAKTGVDRISIGALTKNIQAIDLSMRIAR